MGESSRGPLFQTERDSVDCRRFGRILQGWHPRHRRGSGTAWRTEYGGTEERHSPHSLSVRIPLGEIPSPFVQSLFRSSKDFEGSGDNLRATKVNLRRSSGETLFLRLRLINKPSTIVLCNHPLTPSPLSVIFYPIVRSMTTPFTRVERPLRPPVTSCWSRPEESRVAVTDFDEGPRTCDMVEVPSDTCVRFTPEFRSFSGVAFFVELPEKRLVPYNYPVTVVDDVD